MVRMIFVLLLSAFAYTATAQPIAVHPENPHYFLYKSKPTVLVTSGEHYGAIINLDFNYKKYLNELSTDNLNMTRTFSGVYCEQPGAFNIGANTLAPVANKYITPWARSTTPGYKNGGNKFDLTKWDENYFKRVKDFLNEAARKNVVVEYTFFCPFYEDAMWLLSPMHPSNNVNSTPEITRTSVYTLDSNGILLDIQKKLVEKLVTELNSFDNIIYEICNEPYFGGVTLEWQHAIADVISSTEKSLRKKHLISQNIQNGSSRVERPHKDVSVYNWHYAYPPSTVAMNYNLNKPLGDNETGFRGVSDSTYRFEAWRFMLAGGALFNHLDYSFAIGKEDGTHAYDSTQPGGGSKALRSQLGYLKKFVESFDFVKMSPDSSVASDLVYNCISEKGKQYAIYFPSVLKGELILNIPSGDYDAQWFDPLTGKYKAAQPAFKNNKLVLNFPDYKEDVALKISSKP